MASPNDVGRPGEQSVGIRLERVWKVYPGEVVAIQDVSLEIEAGEFLVLVGPSGCGKSTLLRMIAGLEEVHSGEIYLGDRRVTDEAAKHRDIAMVFQNYALYPHMTVRQNFSFGMRARRVPRATRGERVKEIAEILDLTELLDRRPANLSGGQRQRVAMGRAMVREPSAYLMDEPLSNLDAKLRVAVRAELARVHRRLRTTTVYVTHDQTEAMTLGHRVAVLDNGVLQQCDTPAGLYRRPVNVFVATFIGSPAMNLLRGQPSDAGLSIGPHRLQHQGGSMGLDGNTDVLVGFRPTSAQLVDLNGSRENVIPAKVELVENLGAEQHVMLSVAGVTLADEAVRSDVQEELSMLTSDERAVLTVVADERADLRTEQEVGVRVDPGALHFFDADTGGALTPVSDSELVAAVPTATTPH